MKDLMKKPEITLVSKGDALKILQVTGIPDTSMPKHYSTKEAVVTVLEGRAIMDIDGAEYVLNPCDSLLIPARQVHTLLIVSKLKALVVMPGDSIIEFIS